MKGTILTTDTPADEVPMSTKVHTLSVYVANKPGVLARIAQTFARRGYNIESLVVSPAKDGRFSRMTIGVSGDADGLGEIINAANKLIDVVTCYDHTFDQSVVKEMALVKIGTTREDRAEALQISEHFGCKTVDLTQESMIVMCTGDSGKLDALIRMLGKFNIMELVRTGKVVMLRGTEIS
jgi:acetolactate synthase-1/3 small subunit